MKTLESVIPTPEQLALIANPQLGVQIIRGAAGSGKTSTALLMLRQYADFWRRLKHRQGASGRVKILVLTYNRTLKSYIQKLVDEQLPKEDQTEVTVNTFASWSISYLGRMNIQPKVTEAKIRSLSGRVKLPLNFVIDEVDYLTSRFKPEELTQYLGVIRKGRGILPRMARPLREQLLNQIVKPLAQWKRDTGIKDWNDLAIAMQNRPVNDPYDVIIVDEMQDMSANQLRGIMHFASENASVIFVMDTGQRIYPRGFTWVEAGLKSPQPHRLRSNYRNTRQICRFAIPLLENLELDDDGTFPNLDSCTRDGPLPSVVKGLYSQQIKHAINQIKSSVDLSRESVVFLSQQWSTYLRSELENNLLEFVDLTKVGNWPDGPQNIALSTMHSAKGLEFDHVYILGLNDEITSYDNSPGDSSFENWRRLLAMAITRAKVSVTLGFKPGEESRLISLLDTSTYKEIVL